MDELDRLLRLHEILDAHRDPLSEARLREQLDCGRSTLYRCLNDLKHRFGAPILSTPGRGWSYNRSQCFQMPGLWFTAAEIRALAVMRQILAELEPGLITGSFRSLSSELDRLLNRAGIGAEADLAHRIHMLSQFGRRPDGAVFSAMVRALGARERLRIAYWSRSRDERTHREISPQHLTRYRDNWYVDSWCHARGDLRSFALDRIADVRRLLTPAKEVDSAKLNQHLTHAYGIFSGKPEHSAVLRFSEERARWVAEESWHPQQESRWLDDGCYELRIPYGDPGS